MSPNEKKALLDFLVFWLEGTGDNGQAIGASRECGLCNNAYRYDVKRKGTAGHVDVGPLLKELLRRDFKVMRNGDSLPFNQQDEGMPGYNDEGMAKLCHVNPWRAAWVFKIIKELSREELQADS